MLGSISVVAASALILAVRCCTTLSLVVAVASSVDSTAQVSPRRVMAWMSADCFAGQHATACKLHNGPKTWERHGRRKTVAMCHKNQKIKLMAKVIMNVLVMIWKHNVNDIKKGHDRDKENDQDNDSDKETRR